MSKYQWVICITSPAAILFITASSSFLILFSPKSVTAMLILVSDCLRMRRSVLLLSPPFYKMAAMNEPFSNPIAPPDKELAR